MTSPASKKLPAGFVFSLAIKLARPGTRWARRRASSNQEDGRHLAGQGRGGGGGAQDCTIGSESERGSVKLACGANKAPGCFAQGRSVSRDVNAAGAAMQNRQLGSEWNSTRTTSGEEESTAGRANECLAE